MGVLSRKLVLLIVLLLSSFSLITGCISDLDPRMFSSHITYELEIQTSDQITNATFYIPLPVKNDIPTVGMIVLNKNRFEKNNFSVDLIQTPLDLNLTGTFPVQNNHPWFLKINADQIIPDKTQNAVYKIFIDNLTSPPTPLSFADTIYPINNESIFLPKTDFIPLEPKKITSRSQNRIEYSPIEVPQKIPIYAEYSASSSCKVEIFSSIHGYNSWKEYYDSGGGNSYWDYFEWNYKGESHGWQIADGTYKAAQGVYPNLDHPEWQDVLNQTGSHP